MSHEAPFLIGLANPAGASSGAEQTSVLCDDPRQGALESFVLQGALQISRVPHETTRDGALKSSNASRDPTYPRQQT